MSKKSFGQRQERDWISGFFRRKKRSPQQVSTEHNTSEDSRLMRRHKGKNLHLFLSEIMWKFKHPFKREKSQHDKRLLRKKKRLQKSSSTKDHFFLERMTSIPQKRSHQEHHDNVKHLSEMLNNGDLYRNLAASKQVHVNQRRTVSFTGYSSPFSSPGRIWDHNSIVLSRSASDVFIKSETITEIGTASSEGSSPSVSKSNRIVDDLSKVEASDGEKEREILKQTPHEEYKLVLEPLFIEYEINPARGEAKRKPLCNQNQSNESVFKYIKAVLDAIDSNWEELYLKTEFSDQLLNPALISNIPFYPNQLSVDHELLFDCINEVLFEFCRFPQWVSFVQPRAQVFSLSVESIVHEVQKEVYCRLLPLRFAHSLDQNVRADMAKSRNWLDIRCELECIGFETGELILNELLEELMLDL